MGQIHTTAAPTPRTAGRITLDDDLLLVDLAERTLLLRPSTGEVLGAVDSSGLRLIGIDRDSQVAVFSEELSWSLQLLDLRGQRWLDNPDPDFPRFVLEEEEADSWVRDLETGDRYRLEEPAELTSVRRSA